MKNENSCCPSLKEGKKCDYLDFVYRLTNYTDVNTDNSKQRVAVETAIHIRVERCTGPLQLGNIVYSSTLLPGEKVRLYTQDRRSRFSFDSETKLFYRHEQSAEEQYYMRSMESFMSDFHSAESSQASSSYSERASSRGKLGGLFSTIFSGPSVSISGSFNASSTHDFLRELSVQARSSHNRSVQMTRESNAVQVGEVQSRKHAEGESESHFESNSRVFENKNQCHSVSYLFYQVDKEQTTNVTIKSIKTRVIDPVSKSEIINHPVVADTKLSVIPAAVLATSSKAILKQKEQEEYQLATARLQTSQVSHLSFNAALINTAPLSDSVRKAAINNVNQDLIAKGIFDKSGNVSSQVIKEMNFSYTTSIPTAGIVVKGCLDECNTCEDARKQLIKLEIDNKRLNNQLLEKKIALLENSQEYRCCPVGESEEAEEIVES